MPVTQYIGIDPGKTSGVAVWSNGSLDMALTGEYDEASMYDLLDLLCSNPSSLRVEWFTISARTIKTAVDYSALHMIGSIKYAAHQCGHTISYGQPAEVKLKFPDASLKQAKMWHRSDHVRDAIRHLLVPLVRDGHVDPRKFIL